MESDSPGAPKEERDVSEAEEAGEGGGGQEGPPAHLYRAIKQRCYSKKKQKKRRLFMADLKEQSRGV